MSHWLLAPEPWPVDSSGLPDPLERVGRHVVWVAVLGVVLGHSGYAVTHQGACPPLCRPLLQAAPAVPEGYNEATEAWKRLFGVVRKARKPVEEWGKTERVVPLSFDHAPYS